MKVYTPNHFVTMPWKNGGGITTELFCLRDAQTQDILFRISRAQVGQDGPFSRFPHMDRILVLMEGPGFLLNFQHQQIRVDQIHRPISFSGEDTVDCKLMGGTCTDFNVMTNRHYGESTLVIKNLLPNQRISCKTKASFIYSPTENNLYQLDQGEEFTHDHQNELFIYLIELRTKSL